LDEAREALYQALNADEDDADSAATDRA
jgi:hypothetical protein